MNLFELKECLNEAGAHIAFCGSFSHSLIGIHLELCQVINGCLWIACARTPVKT